MMSAVARVGSIAVVGFALLHGAPVAAQQGTIDFTVSGGSTVRGWTCTVKGTAQITTGALPGRSIRYRITVTNVGTAPATSVRVFDTTPAHQRSARAPGPASQRNGLTPRPIAQARWSPASLETAEVAGRPEGRRRPSRPTPCEVA